MLQRCEYQKIFVVFNIMIFLLFNNIIMFLLSLLLMLYRKLKKEYLFLFILFDIFPLSNIMICMRFLAVNIFPLSNIMIYLRSLAVHFIIRQRRSIIIERYCGECCLHFYVLHQISKNKKS